MLLAGSEWRRWDLHVHTPNTILNNQFGDWPEYLKAVEADPHVKVIGVTDYMSIGNYSVLKSHKDAGRIANVDLLIPNIEFRIAPPTEQATAVNIHVIISPDDPQHEREIMNALARLSWTYNKRQYSCTPDQLRALGRAVDSTAASDVAALRVGTTQFKADFTTLRDWYESEHWLRENSIVAVSAGADGVSGFRRDGAWLAMRDEITRFSQILFSGRPGEREFWLGRGSAVDRETVKNLGGPKPVLHGSDAHKIADLFKPAQNRFCWVKADTTFEGLRQVLYEPQDRVFIGPTAPLYHDKARVIRSVTLSHSGGWFDDVTIPLGTGLVSVIGQKGTGKSALAELIAYAAGSGQEDEEASFLRRAGKYLDGLGVKLDWADGASSTAVLGEESPNGKGVRYLSQKFVERLCADDQLGAELIAEIESVIFSYIDPTDTLNASSFDELRALKTEAIKGDGDRLRADIVRLIREECSLRDVASKLPEKKERIKALTKEHDGLMKQLPVAATPEEARVQKELQEKRLALTKLQQVVATDKQRLQRVKDIRSRIVTFKAQIIRFTTDIEPLLNDIGLPEAERAAFNPAFPEAAEPALTRRTTAIEKTVREREGDRENPAEGTIHALEKQIAGLLAQETADKARQDKIKAIQTRVSAIKTEISRIEIEITRIEGPDRARLKAASGERLAAYVAFFANLKQEQTTLEELYQPVKARLKSDTAATQEQDLEFSIRWEADVAQWLERGGSLFDQRKTIPYGTMQELSAAAKKTLAPAWRSGDPNRIGTAHEAFLAEFRRADLPARGYLRTGVSLEDLLQWLYEVEHIGLSYGLKYNGAELEKLSPGTKGIVLLILYLGIDVGDTRPLIVDQPDENLDNESIYSLLTTYFKAAKQRR